MRKAAITVAIATVFAASPARATNGIRMIGFGPVQNSMGGTSAAAGLDAASILSNPANVSDLGARVDFGATYFDAAVKYKAPADGFFIGNGDEQTSDRGPSPVPAFGLVIPLSDKLTLGLGAYGVAGLGTEYPSNIAGNVTYTNYSQMRFAPGLAYKVNDLVSVGATVNVMYSVLGYTVGSQAIGQMPHDDTSAFGIGATVGVRVTPMKGLAFGAAYESQGFHSNFKYNTPAFSFDPDGPGPAGTMDIPAAREELKFDSPQVATVGAAYRPIDALLLALDVQWINWAGVLGDDKPEYEVSNGASMAFDVEWEDQVVFKVGAEYAALPTLKVRAGYNYGKMPLESAKAVPNLAFPAVAEHHVTFGLGWQATPKLAVNLAAQYSPKAEIAGTDPQFGIAYTTNVSEIGIDAGLAYRF